ncbi:MAG: HAD family phosphatase [Spirochaetes bacterium]|uniref:HAD family phosphatase n=1 Tax=Candidatus Ornithospirochaeta stercoravium TaxID=2840897 RepID=A0A9D9ICA3_9SPIO|nr:HAD family phosphatase [Candidatus Ornithospirochaeta stercoravium]
MDKDLRELCSRKAFLFDFDGVITDSEPFVFEVLKQMIKDNFGIELPYSDINMTIGCSDRKVAEYIANEYHIDYSVELSEKLKKNYPDYYFEYEDIKPFPYLRDLLSILKDRGRKVAIVSSTDRAHLEAALSRMGLSGFIDTIISGSDVQNKKPSPEPYLKGLEALSVDKQDAVVIEDSPTGIQSAVNAGIDCIGFEGSEVKQDTEKASIIIASYKEMIEAIN